jgi:ketosteroid isomerase-like protein
MLTYFQARALVERSHFCWCRRDLDGLLEQYTDDMEFWCNAGALDGGPVELRGKAIFRASLEGVLVTTVCRSHIQSFRYDDGKAFTSAFYRLQHRETRFVLAGSYRQIFSFRDGLIARLEEFHDGGRLTAFWRLVASGAEPSVVVWDAQKASESEPSD